MFVVYVFFIVSDYNRMFIIAVVVKTVQSICSILRQNMKLNDLITVYWTELQKNVLLERANLIAG